MKRLFAVATLGTAFALFQSIASMPARAATLFQAILNSEQEVFPGGQTNSPATGFASLKLNDAGTELAYTINFLGIDFSNLADVGSPDIPLDVATLLHFHNAPRGANGSVVFGIFGPGQDNDDRSVTFNPEDGSTTVSGIWDLDDPANVSLSQFAAGLLATVPGQDTELYLNLHSENDPAGVIRGQVVAADVPEPASALGLLAIGAVGAASQLKRQRNHLKSSDTVIHHP